MKEISHPKSPHEVQHVSEEAIADIFILADNSMEQEKLPNKLTWLQNPNKPKKLLSSVTKFRITCYVSISITRRV